MEDVELSKTKDSKDKITAKDWIAIVTAVIALITAVVNFLYTAKRTNEQEVQIRNLAECADVVARVTEPANGDSVAGRIEINGTTTPGRACNFVFVVVRDKSRAVWKIADLVQANASGQWFGVAQIEDVVSIGGDMEVMVTVSRQPSDYLVGQFLTTPPTKGTSSTNIVRVRRIK